MKHLKYSRRMIAAAAFVATFGIGAVGVSATLAAQGAHDPNTLVEAIASKFNLKVADVQAVFDEQRQKMDTDRERHEADRLKKLVTDGKLTQAQADLLTAKRAELKDALAALGDLDPEQRHEAMKARMDALRKWATDNGIPLQYVGGMFGGPGHAMVGQNKGPAGGGHGPHGGFGHRGPGMHIPGTQSN